MSPVAGGRRVSGRPVSVRLLSVLLLLEITTTGLIIALCLVVAAVTQLRRQSGDWSALAIVVVLLLAGFALFVGVLLGGAWFALRHRSRPAAIALSVLGHLAPTVGLSTLGWSTGTGETLFQLSVALLGLTGIALTLWPSTQAWLSDRRPREVVTP